MFDILTITAFLGWCTLINIGLLIFYTVWLIALGDFTKRVHSNFFGVAPDKLDVIYFQYLASYKVAVIVLNIVPYIALKIMV